MKMKNNLGTGALIETSTLKAYCHKHLPEQWRRDNDVDTAVTDVVDLYANTMTGTQWGDSLSAAIAGLDHALRNGILRNGNLPQIASTFGNKAKRSQDPKSTWKLGSGAPVIPGVIYDRVVKFIPRFDGSEVEEFMASTFVVVGIDWIGPSQTEGYGQNRSDRTGITWWLIRQEEQPSR
ncbi:hypothetical protein B9Z19DRAFT_1130960 [Tuber borchii]|uniref:Uncharacterized protein n=1 Tax=Tuber borchii TaxID=42251 RepID=A0A2T6ZJI1_TUBBO|nr:hypothetical protein B9Z19DRAFT_1130960 [Tuber borchii]